LDARFIDINQNGFSDRFKNNHARPFCNGDCFQDRNCRAFAYGELDCNDAVNPFLDNCSGDRQSNTFDDVRKHFLPDKDIHTLFDSYTFAHSYSFSHAFAKSIQVADFDLNPDLFTSSINPYGHEHAASVGDADRLQPHI
jgi:hypothetical protein